MNNRSTLADPLLAEETSDSHLTENKEEHFFKKLPTDILNDVVFIYLVDGNDKKNLHSKDYLNFKIVNRDLYGPIRPVQYWKQYAEQGLFKGLGITRNICGAFSGSILQKTDYYYHPNDEIDSDATDDHCCANCCTLCLCSPCYLSIGVIGVVTSAFCGFIGCVAGSLKSNHIRTEHESIMQPPERQLMR